MELPEQYRSEYKRLRVKYPGLTVQQFNEWMALKVMADLAQDLPDDPLWNSNEK